MNECKIQCDYCGATPAYWFGETSVAVCSSPECHKENNIAWKATCDAVNSEYDEDFL